MTRDMTEIANLNRPAVKALIDRDPQANAALVSAAEYLECSARNLSAAFAIKGDDGKRSETVILSAAYGAIAYLLHVLHDVDQSTASDAAWEIAEMVDDGQAIAEWVGDRLAALGLDAGALPEVTA